MSRDRLAAYAWTVLGAELLVILWQASRHAIGATRLGQGLTNASVLLMVTALLVAARRTLPPGHRVRRGAVWAMIFTLAAAAIGAVVLFGMVAENDWAARALFTGAGLGSTFLLLAALTSTAWWAGGGAAFALRGRGRRLWLAAASLAAALLMAGSGAVAALDETLMPAKSLAEAVRLDLSLTSHLLIQLRASHPLIAVLVSLLLLYYIGTVRRHNRPREAKRFANLLNLAIYLQLIAGAINIMLLAPIWMRLLHLLLADLLWILLVLTCAANLARPDTGVDS